jgi:hypothetical protein
MSFIRSNWTASWKGHPVKVTSSGITHGFEVDVAGKVAVKRVITMTGAGHWEGDVEVDGKNAHVVVEIVGTLKDSEAALWIDGEKLALTPAGS